MGLKKWEGEVSLDSNLLPQQSIGYNRLDHNQNIFVNTNGEVFELEACVPNMTNLSSVRLPAAHHQFFPSRTQPAPAVSGGLHAPQVGLHPEGGDHLAVLPPEGTDRLATAGRGLEDGGGGRRHLW